MQTKSPNYYLKQPQQLHSARALKSANMGPLLMMELPLQFFKRVELGLRF